MQNAYIAKQCLKLASTFIAATEEVELVLNQRLHFGVEDPLDSHTRSRLDMQRKRALYIVYDLMSLAGAKAYKAADQDFDSQSQDSGESPACDIPRRGTTTTTPFESGGKSSANSDLT